MTPRIAVVFGLVALSLLSFLACRKAVREGGDAEQDTRLVEPPSVSSRQASETERAGALRTEARGLTDRFQVALKEALLEAMREGGPAAAISVCRLEAPRIAKVVPARAERGDWTLGRTAMRVRNPVNRPSEWQTRGLEAFARAVAENPKVDLAELEWHEIHEGVTFRYMRAIPMGGMCVTCHGPAESLASDVKAKLAEIYPEDEATDFSVGELRGAFVVTAPL
jgi:hypothetical protein